MEPISETRLDCGGGDGWLVGIKVRNDTEIFCTVCLYSGLAEVD